MKKITFYSLLFVLVAAFNSCVKNDDIVFRGLFAEIDAASWNANAAGVTYPILTRKVPDNRPVSTSVDSSLRRLSGLVRVRVNLVGPQSDKDETVGYTTFSSPVTSFSFPATISGQTPAQPAATLTVTDGVAGTHFVPLAGTVTIPAKSSFGYIDVTMLAGTATAGQARFLGIQLNSSGTIKPSENYSRVGLIIDQR